MTNIVGVRAVEMLGNNGFLSDVIIPVSGVSSGSASAGSVPMLNGVGALDASIAPPVNAESILQGVLPVGNGMPVSNAAVKTMVVNTSTTGSTIDLYTVPAGKRALISSIICFNNSGSSLFGTEMMLKIGGTYYRYNNTTLLATNTMRSFGSAVPYVAEAGESLSILNPNVQPLTFFISVIEFDNTSQLKTMKLTTTLVTGFNTLYQVPAGKSAILWPLNGTTGLSTQGVFASNDSGGSRVLTFYYVPSGGTPGSTNQLGPSVSPANANTAILPSTPAAMGSGDSLQFNLDAATATQMYFVTMVEF